MAFNENQNLKFPRRTFLAGAAALGVGAALSPLERALAASGERPAGLPDTVNVIEARDKSRFAILGVTDLHLHFMGNGYLLDRNTMKDIEDMAAKFKPDMLAVTGDVWPKDQDGNQFDMCKASCKQIARVGLPWAFAWGNHDAEGPDWPKCHGLLQTAPNSLYRGESSNGNYTIEVRRPGESQAAWNLIFLNDSKGGMKQEQVDWFVQEEARIQKASSPVPPALLFFHIPIQQYDDLADSGKLTGVRREQVCHEGGTRDALAAFSRTGMVKAMFCGHDHVNDYEGEMDGVQIEYLRATGYGGYGADMLKKGGTIIEMDLASGEFSTKTVFADGSTWEPTDWVDNPKN